MKYKEQHQHREAGPGALGVRGHWSWVTVRAVVQGSGRWL